jgi:hypothetical protein
MMPKSLKNDEIVFSGRIIPNVIDVDYLGDYRLYLEFDDGKCGEVDLLPYINKTPVLQAIKDHKKFTQFSLSDGTIAWSYDMDISPRWLHNHTQSKK